MFFGKQARAHGVDSYLVVLCVLFACTTMQHHTDRNTTWIAASGVIQDVLWALGNHSGDIQLHRHGLRALTNLATDGLCVGGLCGVVDHGWCV